LSKKIKTLAGYIYELIKHLKWEYIHLVGLSMGGMIAQELAVMLINENNLLSLSLAVTHQGSAGANMYISPTTLGHLIHSLLTTDPKKQAKAVAKMVFSKRYLSEKISTTKKRIDELTEILSEQLTDVHNHAIPKVSLGQLLAVVRFNFSTKKN